MHIFNRKCANEVKMQNRKLSESTADNTHFLTHSTVFMSIFYNPFIMLSVLLKAGYYIAHTKKHVNGCAINHENQDKTKHFSCYLNLSLSNLCLENSCWSYIPTTPTHSLA
jgi:hypothetical protein